MCITSSRINIIKMIIPAKTIYRSNAIPIKLPMALFTNLKQTNKILKFILRHKRPQIAKAILKKKNWAGGIQAFWLQTRLQSYSHQKSMVLAQNRNTEQWKRTEKAEINPHTYNQLIYDKGSNTIQRRNDILFNRWCWENWTATCKKWN